MSRKLLAPSDSICRWEDIDFRLAEYRVKKLQKRIATAYKCNDSKTVAYLQNKMINSFYAKALAVRRVTSNRGKKTPGSDGVTWKTPEEKWNAVLSLRQKDYHAQPLKAVYIPKANGSFRPLSIPTIKDRAMQTLYKFALEPIAEVSADLNSYGYRSGRSSKLAARKCLNILNRAPFPSYILKTDIQSCFSKISHEWILKNIPLDEKALNNFIIRQDVENKKPSSSGAGIPQGSCLSPVICNMALDGLEQTLMSACRNAVSFIRYADDILLISTDESLLIDTAIPVINEFLAERGLKLSSRKTIICPVENGFDFVGYHFCRCRFNDISYVVPPRGKITSLIDGVIDTLTRDANINADFDKVCKLIKPKLNGWLNYFADMCFDRSMLDVECDVVSALWSASHNRDLTAFVGSLFSSRIP